MASILKTTDKSTSNRQSDTMFLRMVLDCDCLSNSHIKMLAVLANTYFEQAQFSIELKRQNTGEGPNIP